MAPIKKRSPTRKVERRSVKRPVNKNKKTEKNGALTIGIILALILLIFIGYFVFVEKKPDPYIVKEEVIIRKKEEKLPEKPESTWEYENNLKGKNVEVDIPKKKVSSLRYQMQCGSFRAKDQAEALKAKIAFKGLASQVKKTGNWYRVILGPYNRKREAEKDKHFLQRSKIYGCAVWTWR